MTKNLSVRFVWKNVYSLVFMFPNNPQKLNPGRTAMFWEI